MCTGCRDQTNERNYCLARRRDLNRRKRDPNFVLRVNVRLFNEKLSILKHLLKVLKVKVNGIELDDEHFMFNEDLLLKVSDLSETDFREAVNYGIQTHCLKRETKISRVRITLISENITNYSKAEEDKVKDVDQFEDEKRIRKDIFRINKESCFENEKEEVVYRESSVKKQIKSNRYRTLQSAKFL